MADEEETVPAPEKPDAPAGVIPPPGTPPGKAPIQPAPAAPPECRDFQLTHEQHLALEAAVWKSRAMTYKAQSAQQSAQLAVDDARGLAREAARENATFLTLAQDMGIEADRPFEWNDKGKVIYLDAEGKAPKKKKG